MMKSDAVILVTGCSSGIGLEVAKKLAKSSFRAVVTAREKSLKEIQAAGLVESDNFWIRPMDVIRDEDRRRVVDEIESRWGGVDVLVNNAGISYRAVVEHMTEEEEWHQMLTNYIGPMSLIRLVLPSMRTKRFGRIINISSVSGMMAMPTMSSYAASKFALEGASESLWYELRPFGIHVSLVQPGFVRSESFKRVLYSKAASVCDLERDPYCRYYGDMAPFIENLMHRSQTTAEDIACKVFALMNRKQPLLRVPATLDAWIFYWLRRLLPRRFYHRFLYWGLPGVHEWAKVKTKEK